MIYYSKTTQGFYCEEIHGTNIPPDCVQITTQQHADLMHNQSQGKQIVANKQGYPVAKTPAVAIPTWQQIRKQRDAFLKDSDWSVASDVVPKPSKQAWIAYRQALRDVPTVFDTPETVIWPNPPNK